MSKAASSRHPAFPRSRATIGGSHNFIAASFMRTVISAHRFVVSRLTLSEPATDDIHLDAGFQKSCCGHSYVALPLEGQRRGLAVHGRNMIAPAFARSADALGTLTVSAGRP